MNKETIKKAAEEKLDVISEQFEIIRNYSGKIPHIELDLLMSNIRDLYELMIYLEKDNDSTELAHEEPKKQKAPPPVITTLKEEKKIEVTQEPEEVQPEQPENPVIPESATKEKITATKVFEPVIEPDPAASPEENIPETDQSEPEQTPKITFDLFSDSGLTLAEKLKETSEKRVADKLEKERIKDLKSFIGINEKFLFINELFDGNLRIYEEAVKKLNECNDEDEAMVILHDFQVTYSWEPSGDSVQQFINLVKKRF